MKLTKSMKMAWWQVALFKLSVVSFGIIVGVWFYEFFRNYLLVLAVLTVVPGAYIAYLWINQK